MCSPTCPSDQHGTALEHGPSQALRNDTPSSRDCDVAPGDYPIVILHESGNGSTLGSTMEASLAFRVS